MSALASTSSIGKIVRLPLRLIPKDAVVRVLSGPLMGAKWIVGSATHGSWLGSYEADKAWAFRKAITPGAVVYDIGAHVGYYSLIAARAGAHVFSFEPLPRNLRYLDRHLALNNASVRVIRAAVSDQVGIAMFAEARRSEMGKLSNEGTIKVDTVAVDSLNLPLPSVVKMDVEGGEAAALRGMQGVMRHGPTIFLATHSDELNIECSTILRDFGYTVTAIDGQPLATTREILAVKH
jgi:FkbM family methyltransferase